MGIQFTGLASGLDTQSIISELMDVENLKVVKVENKQQLLEWKKDAWSDVNTKLYSFYKEELFDFKSNGTYKAKTVTSSNETAVTVGTSSAAPVGSHEVVVSQMAKGSFLAGDALGTDLSGDAITLATKANEIVDFGTTTSIKLHIKTAVGEEADESNEITINASDSISQIISSIKELDADLSVNYDSKFNRFFVSSTKTGETVQLDFASPDDVSTGDDAIKTSLLAGMGFADGKTTGTVGTSASFTYNGTALTSDTNDISVNGLSLTIRSNTGTSTIAVTTNTDDIYNSVKSFIAKYNEISQEMMTKVNADSASDYDVLTDEEKDAMTDDEIETWENTIKGSLLRNDSTMSNLVYAMRSTLTLSSGVNTTGMGYNYLSDIGITTGSYTENGLLHIQGDEDDSLYSTSTNKLRQAIEDNPEKLMEFLTAIGKSLYENMADRMKSTTLSSSLTFYNNKFMDSQMDDYDDKISDLQDQLDTIEERYYTQFTAMELAIQESNSTGEWLSAQLANL